jgi:hypothetical protein
MTSVSLQPVPSLLHRGLCPLGTPHQKKRTLLLYLCGGVEKNKKYKNKRNSRFLHAVTTKLLI